MKTILLALAAFVSVAAAAIPHDLDFLKSLLPNSRHVSTQIVNGRLAGGVLSIYEGNDSVETAAAALTQKFGEIIPRESSKDLGECARVFGESGLGQPTVYKQYSLENLMFSIFSFELKVEDVTLKKTLILIESI